MRIADVAPSGAMCFFAEEAGGKVEQCNARHSCAAPAPAREVAAPSSPLLPGRRPWRVPARGHGGEQVLGKRRGGAAAAAPPGAAARPQDHGDEAEAARAEGEGLRVNFPLVEGFFCKKPRNCTISAVRAPDRTAGKSGRRGHARC